MRCATDTPICQFFIFVFSFSSPYLPTPNRCPTQREPYDGTPHAAPRARVARTRPAWKPRPEPSSSPPCASVAPLPPLLVCSWPLLLCRRRAWPCAFATDELDHVSPLFVPRSCGHDKADPQSSRERDCGRARLGGHRTLFFLDGRPSPLLLLFLQPQYTRMRSSGNCRPTSSDSVRPIL